MAVGRSGGGCLTTTSLPAFPACLCPAVASCLSLSACLLTSHHCTPASLSSLPLSISACYYLYILKSDDRRAYLMVMAEGGQGAVCPLLSSSSYILLCLYVFVVYIYICLCLCLFPVSPIIYVCNNINTLTTTTLPGFSSIIITWCLFSWMVMSMSD